MASRRRSRHGKYGVDAAYASQLPLDDAHVGGAGLELLEQPGLADARLADDLDEGAAAVDGAAERGLEHGQLLGPTDEREARVPGGAAA